MTFFFWGITRVLGVYRPGYLLGAGMLFLDLVQWFACILEKWFPKSLTVSVIKQSSGYGAGP